ncbi:hypothetical protein ACF0H5_015885 [Mactra antiquata]
MGGKRKKDKDSPPSNHPKSKREAKMNSSQLPSSQSTILQDNQANDLPMNNSILQEPTYPTQQCVQNPASPVLSPPSSVLSQQHEFITDLTSKLEFIMAKVSKIFNALNQNLPKLA